MITGVNHITLVVAEVPRAVTFYTSILGMSLRAQGPCSAYLESGSLWLCLEQGTPSHRADDSHIALSCTAEDFKTLCARLTDWRQWKTNRSEGASLYLLDPDGHKLELHLGSLESRLAHYRLSPPDGMQVF
ncbi:catechol 2,3-dioxygenase-like lactoylglutathione lyase family enzyme [Roseinatronobacter thiooxidans]|uniref:Catechol 2,3-dioxygenase-like lactoylglutathione lyase family enzyme n=1 Tax=Roseinatronobacter thiooxidans TaxID=121821 RepID=A0A2W7PRK3_9RHOB|nr:VOC family protein [Roseinatronobacter thiooxidans]PZX38964.1 catechol 2,3-dioxygenase-like lactoylglutathione lyase family enzyme [Roseinatronobacter thiooxidans]